MNQATFRTEKPRITDGSLEQQSEKSGPALFSDVFRVLSEEETVQSADKKMHSVPASVKYLSFNIQNVD